MYSRQNWPSICLVHYVGVTQLYQWVLRVWKQESERLLLHAHPTLSVVDCSPGGLSGLASTTFPTRRRGCNGRGDPSLKCTFPRSRYPGDQIVLCPKFLSISSAMVAGHVVSSRDRRRGVGFKRASVPLFVVQDHPSKHSAPGRTQSST